MSDYKKNGEVSWGSSNDDKKAGGGKDQYLRLQTGSNVIRILTAPNQYYQHTYMPEGGKKYGYRVNCSAANGSCPLCERGEKAKRRWLVGVIDRKTGSYRILDIGYGVFKGIQTLNNSEDWQSPLNYNLDIVMNPNAGPTSFYTVVPKPKTALSAADLVIQQENDSARITEKTMPPTLEQIQKRLDRIHEEIKSNAPAASVNAPMSGSVDTSSDDFFPDHNSNAKASF